MTTNFDSVMSTVDHIDEEIDTLRVKLEIIDNNYLSEEFVIITGVCAVKDKHIIERMIFRKTHGHSYLIFRKRPDQKPK